MKKLLTEEFLMKYKGRPDPLSNIGAFTFYRTYARNILEEGRKERFWETLARAVEYNCSLSETTTREEAEELYDNMYNLRQTISSRTVYTGGTLASLLYPMSNFNCAYRDIDSIKALTEVFYVSMVGTGVGCGIGEKYIKNLPKFRTDVELVHKEYSPVLPNHRKDRTKTDTKNGVMLIIVGDSKEGWKDALGYFLEAISEDSGVNKVIMDYSNVRPHGEPLKTFGGYASGHESFKRMIEKIFLVVEARKEEGKLIRLHSIDVMDICNIIGENVVSGGVRRTSEIMFIDYDDEEALNAKSSLWRQDEETGKWVRNEKISHREMSNNSALYYQKPTREQLHKNFQMMRFSGEPAMVNAEEAKRRNPNFKGLNPCAEILLDSEENCNLTTINVNAFVIQDAFTGEYHLDEEGLLRAQYLSTRAGYRMTNVELELPNWNEKLKRDRLLGTSLTGWKDAVTACGFTRKQEIELKKKLRKTAHKAMKEIAKELGGNESLLVTTVKPEGTYSLVMGGVSAGVHYSHSQYYIRRIRISGTDPVFKAVKKLGWSIKFDKDDTWIVEIPMKSNAKVFKKDVSAIEQLEDYKDWMEHYVDHNASNTVHVRDHEWDEVEEWVWNNWDTFVGISYISLDDSFYENMPYEECTEEEYYDLLSRTPDFDPELVNEFLSDVEEDIEDVECVSGACPIR